MDITKRLSIMLTFCLFFLFSLMGNSSASSSVIETDQKEVVNKAYQKLLKLKSYRMTMDVTTSSYLHGKDVNTTIKDNCDIQVKPMMGKHTTDIGMDFSSTKIEQQLVHYFEGSGKDVVVYSNVNNQWFKKVVPYYSPLKEFENYMKAITGVTLISEDKNSLLFEVVAKGSSIGDNLERYLSSTNVQNIKLTTDILKNIGDFTYTITVDKKTSAISKSNIDLTKLMYKIGDQLTESQDLSEEEKKIMKHALATMKLNVNVVFSEWNRVGKITIPVAAKNAIGNESFSTKPSSNFFQSKRIGFVDVSRVIAESSVVKTLQNDLDRQGKVFSDELLIEKSTLTEETFRQKQNETYQEFLGLKKNLENQINKNIEQAANLVIKEKKLDFVIYKTTSSEKTFIDSVDITSRVINRMEGFNQKVE